MHNVCCSHGLRQYVREPTRQHHLLDLVLADCGGLLKVKVVNGLSDHKGVWGELKLSVPEVSEVERLCFNYAKAGWEGLRGKFAETSWEDVLPANDADVDASAAALNDYICNTVLEFVPHRVVRTHKATHPWLDDSCRHAIREKHKSFGRSDFVEKRDHCTSVLRHAYWQYAASTRDKLCSMPPSSKQWWKQADRLMLKAGGISSIPPLRKPDGSWARDGLSKAELLSDTFASKSSLPAPQPHSYSPPNTSLDELDDMDVAVYKTNVLKVLAGLDESSGTGPARIASRVLKRCRTEFLDGIYALCCRVVTHGIWPDNWREHWIHAIYKRKARSDPANYRGVHLISQLSKVCGRVVSSLVSPFLDHGVNQFAYRQGRGHRDALLFNIMQWILCLEAGDSVALYCSDVSGAFDKVCKETLLRKIGGLQMPRCLGKLLKSWLGDRFSKVVVDGSASSGSPLTDSVFQGTVLGPQLWNQHFSDANVAVRKRGFLETVYADDMNAFKRIRRGTAEGDIQDELVACQHELHEWGRGNRVTFDSGKESFHVLHRLHPSRSSFKILGVVFDNHLLMHGAVRMLAIQGGWRLRAILRARRFFSIGQLVLLFMAQVLSYLESGCLAFIHAPSTTMDPVDRILRRFLRETGLSERDALIEYNLAPLVCRRHIAALCVLHRRILGQLPAPLAEMLPLDTPRDTQHRTRLAAPRHDKQLVDPVRGRETQLFKRSMFGYVGIYNRLPQSVVEAKSVKVFQRKLQFALRAFSTRNTDLESFLSYRSRLSDIARFQSYFQ